MSGAGPDVLVTSSGSTSIHSLPASNPAGTPDTVALPVQGVTGGVPQPVSISSLPLPSGAAGDGTDATGITPLAGATGIRGWLSSIYNTLGNIYTKLIGSIAVTGTIAQGSTTSGQSGLVGMQAVLTSPPTWTSGQTQPLNCGVNGGTRVDISGSPLATGANVIGTTGSIGSASIATGQVTVTTSATLICAQRTGRLAVTIINKGTTEVELGISSVTTAAGVPLPGVQWASFTIPTQAAVYGIVASGTQSVAFQETF